MVICAGQDWFYLQMETSLRIALPVISWVWCPTMAARQFTWEDSEGAGWVSPVISIDGYIADFSASPSEETNIDVSDNLTLYISIDGGPV